MAEALNQLINQLSENFEGESTIYSLTEEWAERDMNSSKGLVYPLKLNEDYKASVEFSPRRREPVDIQGLFSRGLSALKNITGENSAIGRFLTSKRDNDLDFSNLGGEIDTFIGQNSTGDNALTAEELNILRDFKAENADYNFTVDPRYLRLVPTKDPRYNMSCEIYLPQALQFRDNVAYNNLNLGLVGGQAANVLSNTGGDGNIISAIGSIFKQTLGSGATGDMARLGTTFAAGFVPGDQVQGAVRQLTRANIAPNARTQFEAPNIRDFQFTFRFIPTSRTEAETVQDIIKFFRYHMYPDKIPPGSNVEFPLGYNFPSLFEINLKYGGISMSNRDSNLKILPCYLVSCDVNYNQTAMGFHEGGKFNEIEMALNFREEKALSREDVEEVSITQPLEEYLGNASLNVGQLGVDT